MGQLRSLSLCILLLLATGCATTANYERILSSWVGSDADNPAALSQVLVEPSVRSRWNSATE